MDLPSVDAGEAEIAVGFFEGPAHYFLPIGVFKTKEGLNGSLPYVVLGMEWEDAERKDEQQGFHIGGMAQKNRLVTGGFYGG